MQNWQKELFLLMKVNKVTQAVLAQEMGCTQQYVSKVLGSDYVSEAQQQRLYTCLGKILDRREVKA